MKGRAVASSAALLLGLAGCASSKTDERISPSAQPIVNGTRSGAEHDGVLLLRAVLSDQTELLCTASLVAPNLIITARHCVSYFSDGVFSCSVRGELIDNPDGAGRLGLHLPAASIEVYDRPTPRLTPLAHGQRVLSTLSPTICENDLAFVVLDTALTLPIVPLRIGRPARAGELGVLVGYGLTAKQTGIDYRSQPRLEKRDLAIDAVGPDSIADGVTTVPPRALILNGPSGCIGDSGGPLLAEETGAILGIYSLEAGEDCSEPGVSHQLVHVPPFEALIADAFAAAGAQPLLETDPSTSSTAGAGSAADAAAAGGSEQAASNASAGAAGAANSVAPAAAPAHVSSCQLTSLSSRGPGATFVLMLLAARGARRRRAARLQS